jgi:hypothetical protein
VKLDKCEYIMTPDPISTAYFINPSHQSMGLLCISHLFAGQRFYKKSAIIARQQLSKIATETTNIHVTIE